MILSPLVNLALSALGADPTMLVAMNVVAYALIPFAAVATLAYARATTR